MHAVESRRFLGLAKEDADPGIYGETSMVVFS